MTNEEILTKYIQELSTQRTNLEYSVLQLKAQVDELIKERDSQTDSAKQSGEVHQPSTS